MAKRCNILLLYHIHNPNASFSVPGQIFVVVVVGVVVFSFNVRMFYKDQK